jgi:hypothetical protein
LLIDATRACDLPRVREFIARGENDDENEIETEEEVAAASR